MNEPIIKTGKGLLWHLKHWDEVMNCKIFKTKDGQEIKIWF